MSTVPCPQLLFPPISNHSTTTTSLSLKGALALSPADLDLGGLSIGSTVTVAAPTATTSQANRCKCLTPLLRLTRVGMGARMAATIRGRHHHHLLLGTSQIPRLPVRTLGTRLGDCPSRCRLPQRLRDSLHARARLPVHLIVRSMRGLRMGPAAVRAPLG
jgi:hypothetical protein